MLVILEDHQVMGEVMRMMTVITIVKMRAMEVIWRKKMR